MSELEQRTSKFLSYVLRHRPDEIGLELDAAGWADVDALIMQAQAHGRSLTRELIVRVVANNDKQRFALSPDGTKIRANQGHSTSVELGLAPVVPPDVLFHGTAEHNVGAIFEAGLVARGRQHVHLSSDAITARQVGARHGRPVVLSVAATAMSAAGHSFFHSENGVWLTEHVPARFIARLDDGAKTLRRG